MGFIFAGKKYQKDKNVLNTWGEKGEEKIILNRKKDIE